MTRVHYRDWVFDCDVEGTRKAYEEIPAGGVDTCDCSGCRNFLAQRESAFPKEVLTLFSQLGINYERDAEIYHVCRLDSGMHSYGGWFHFMGSIAEQPNGPATISEHFTIDFMVNNALAAKAFEKHKLVQVEITAELPWVLIDEPQS